MHFIKMTTIWVLFWTGFALIGYAGLNLINQYQKITKVKLEESVQAVRAQTLELHDDINQKPVENKIPVQIEFPTLRHRVNVIPNRIVDGQWRVAETQANYLIGSGVIGDPGNVVIYAHKRPMLFGSLTELHPGDRIIVRSRDITTEYIVSGASIVPPDQVDILADTSEQLLTLYTCNGWADEDRLVVKAKLKNRQPNITAREI